MPRKNPVIKRTKRAAGKVRRSIKAIPRKIRKAPSRNRKGVTAIGAIRALGRKSTSRSLKRVRPDSLRKMIRKSRKR